MGDVAERSAPGQAVAKAMRTREGVSVMRAAMPLSALQKPISRKSPIRRFGKLPNANFYQSSARAPSRSYCRIEALQLDACIGSGELPVCLGVILIAVLLPGGD